MTVFHVKADKPYEQGDPANILKLGHLLIRRESSGLDVLWGIKYIAIARKGAAILFAPNRPIWIVKLSKSHRPFTRWMQNRQPLWRYFGGIKIVRDFYEDDYVPPSNEDNDLGFGGASPYGHIST